MQPSQWKKKRTKKNEGKKTASLDRDSMWCKYELIFV